jgi:ADP-ribosylglycohydrolase
MASLYSYVGTDMLVAESVATAFGLVYLADGDPMKAMTYGANIGGDTDTIAAIAGAICGAFQGINTVDAGLLAQVDSVNALNLAEEARFAEAISRKVS